MLCLSFFSLFLDLMVELSKEEGVEDKELRVEGVWLFVGTELQS